MSIETANKIRKLLIENNLQQKNLIAHLEEKQANISKWLSEKEDINNQVPYSQLVKIAKFLNTTTDYLLGASNNSLSFNKQKEQIARQEIQKDPQKYLEYFLSVIEKVDYSDEDINLLKDALS